MSLIVFVEQLMGGDVLVAENSVPFLDNVADFRDDHEESGGGKLFLMME